MDIHIKREDFYKDIVDDVDRWFDTSNYDKDDNRPLPIGKNEKVIGMFKVLCTQSKSICI